MIGWRVSSRPSPSRLLALALGPACLLAFALEAGAAVYYYKDENGRVSITDVPPHEGFKVMTPTEKKQEHLETAEPPPTPSAARLKAEIAAQTIYDVDDTRYATMISESAKRHRLPFNLVRAVIKCESDFDPKDVSRSGAMGLMQLMPKTAALVGVKDAFDPRQNIEGGSTYLRQMLDLFKGDLALALAAYNAGPTRVLKEGSRIPPIRETQNYVRKVTFYYNLYERKGGALAESDSENRLAIQAFREGRTRRAMQGFRRVTEIAPDFAPAYYNLGYIHAEEGRFSRAIEFYRKALARDPYLKAAYYNLAVLSERRGDYDEAIRIWREYIAYESSQEKVETARLYITELQAYLDANR